MKTYLHILLLCLATAGFSQHEFTKWYFGNHTGLDFMASPPSVISHTTLNTFEGSASAADAAGNLLFYTDGDTIWNKLQLVMANGTGLFGDGSTVQAALIVKQPGNANIFFVFTLDDQGGPHGLRYSLVDMNLAAGMGSVTVKNATITTPCTEQLNATRHCNGTDMWIVAHDLNSNNFKSYLLTASGLNLSPVVSAVGPAPPVFPPNNNAVYGQGTIKLSPSGKKLGLTYFNSSYHSEVALFDFDRSTGLVSNYLSLLSNTTCCYGCEFSGDGTKFYTSTTNNGPFGVYQWDLCAGSGPLVVASKTLVGVPQSASGQLQLAPNGKIYLVPWASQTLSAINNPDLPGTACNYTVMAQPVAPGTNGTGLPNFFGGAFKNLPPFTYTVNSTITCATVLFTAPSNPTVDCSSSGYSVQSISWNFGQPATGALNTSTLNNPTHNFGAPGNYPVKLIFNYQCGADTVYQTITISHPTITVSNSPVSCSVPGSATVSISGSAGPFTYTWMPSAQATPIATVNPGTYTISINDGGGNCIRTATTLVSPAIPFTGVVTVSNSCNGTSNGAAGINLTAGSGGTGNYTYSWSNGQTTPGALGLAAGIYTVTVTDANCVLTKTFQVVQPPVLSLTITPSISQVCLGFIAPVLHAVVAGGTGPFAYSWSGGVSTASFVVAQTTSGTTVFSVSVTDQNGCSATAATQIAFLSDPVLAVQNRTICLHAAATLSVSGASSYTWSPGGTTGSTYTASPTSVQVYSVSGSFTNGCSSNATAIVTVLNCLSIQEQDQETILKIYPNPVSAELFIEAGEQIEIIIYDPAGRELIRKQLDAGTGSVSTNALKSGLYFLKASGKSSYPVKKIIRAE